MSSLGNRNEKSRQKLRARASLSPSLSHASAPLTSHSITTSGATPYVLAPLHRVLATPPVASDGASADNADADADASPPTPHHHRQLLALATLEALVKNCRLELHTALVNSPLWRPTAAEGGTGVLAAASAGAPLAASSAAARGLYRAAEVRDRAWRNPGPA